MPSSGSAARLIDAAWLDDDRLKSLYGLFQVNKDCILHQGVIKQETGFSLTSANSMQSRFFVIYIDHAWRPHISYHKERFQASACEPGCRPDALGSHSLDAFTFTPTKKARNSDNLRSWRIDFKDHASANKCDKLVLEFNSDQDCHEWQAALSLCKTGLQSFAEGRAQKSAQTEPPVTIAPTLLESQPAGAAAAAVSLELACTVHPNGLAGGDNVHAVVTAAAATGQPCFWWITEKLPKRPVILKVQVDAGVFTVAKRAAGPSSSASAFNSVYSILSPEGFTLRDLASAIVHKAIAQGLVPSATTEDSFVVCACIPHPHLPPAVANHAIVASAANLDTPVSDVIARLGCSCLWSARGVAPRTPVVLPIAQPLPCTLRSYNVVLAGAAPRHVLRACSIYAVCIIHRVDCVSLHRRAGVINAHYGTGWMQAHASLILYGDSNVVLHVHSAESPAPPPFLCVPVPNSPTAPLPPVAVLPGVRSDGCYTVLMRGSRLACAHPPPVPVTGHHPLLLSMPDAATCSAWQVYPPPPSFPVVAPRCFPPLPLYNRRPSSAQSSLTLAFRCANLPHVWQAAFKILHLKIGTELSPSEQAEIPHRFMPLLQFLPGKSIPHPRDVYVRDPHHRSRPPFLNLTVICRLQIPARCLCHSR